MRLFKLRLQMFAEGGDGDGGADGAPGVTNTDPDAGGQNGRRKSNPLANVQYGKKEDTSGEDDTHKEPEEVKTSFEDLINGEYKDDYNQHVNEVIRKRLDANKQETRQLEDRINSTNEILEILGSKYGIGVDDLGKLKSAIEEDASFYEEEAAEKGMTVEQLKQIRKMERENAALKKARAEAERRQNADNIYQKWMQQAESAREYYPNFDFKTETLNQEFNDLIKNGIDVKTAYEVVHHDEILGGAMQYTAQQAQKKTVDTIRARGTRPAENGINSQAGIVTKTDVKSLTRKDREEIERRVLRGEKISF